VNETVWRFSRAEQELALSRSDAANGVRLVIADDRGPRSYLFPDLPALARFQSDLEQFLLRTGWTFVAFSPDRRTGRDRRTWPRRANDRRRWWTDGLPKAPSRRQRSS
jgi:hypothetical protein